jgi:hypothetical protein
MVKIVTSFRTMRFVVHVKRFGEIKINYEILVRITEGCMYW